MQSDTRTAEPDVRNEPVAICILCGTPGRSIHEDLTDRLFGVEGRWGIKRCDNARCRMLWVDPRPVAEDIARLYRKYFTHPGHADAPRTVGGEVREVASRLYNVAMSRSAVHVERRERELVYLGKLPPGRLLEVGCGDGTLLDRLHRRGWQVEGQEVDPVAAAAVRERCGHTVHLGELPLLELPGGRYDAIVMSHVIEHLLDPVAILGECRRLLVPSGVLVSVTPNADSFGHREFGRNWLGLDPPRHLHVFTPPSLEAVARAAGFGVATVDTTAAFGAIYAGASLSLARNGRMQGIAGLGWGEHARATLFQLRAHRAWKRDPLSGEELILRASP